MIKISFVNNSNNGVRGCSETVHLELIIAAILIRSIQYHYLGYKNDSTAILHYSLDLFAVYCSCDRARMRY